MQFKKLNNDKKKDTKKPPVKKPVEIFRYAMLRKTCVAKEIAALADLPEDKKEVWTDSNICELLLANDSLVFEDAMEDFSYEEDQEFLKSQGISNVYAVTFMDTDEEKAMEIIRKVIETSDGILCSDTEDFAPVIFGKFTEA